MEHNKLPEYLRKLRNIDSIDEFKNFEDFKKVLRLLGYSEEETEVAVERIKLQKTQG